jgi:hypothetical protein
VRSLAQSGATIYKLTFSPQETELKGHAKPVWKNSSQNNALFSDTFSLSK